MEKTVVGVEGMMCEMCEQHVDEAVRAAFDVQSVISSRDKKTTEIITEDHLDEQKLTDIINATGYTVTSVESAPYQKKNFFRR